MEPTALRERGTR
uniref:Uncharacterized protein n=1 Tax=Anguilla anguilla TaxID=7936 RepID=A0A0E9RCL4_ANGAN